jgi:hypothetical protein
MGNFKKKIIIFLSFLFFNFSWSSVGYSCMGGGVFCGLAAVWILGNLGYVVIHEPEPYELNGVSALEGLSKEEVAELTDAISKEFYQTERVAYRLNDWKREGIRTVQDRYENGNLYGTGTFDKTVESFFKANRKFPKDLEILHGVLTKHIDKKLGAGTTKVVIGSLKHSDGKKNYETYARLAGEMGIISKHIWYLKDKKMI